MYNIILATVPSDASGIQLRLAHEKTGEISMFFLPKEQCGRIPPNSNPKEELEKLAEVMKGKKVKLEQ